MKKSLIIALLLAISFFITGCQKQNDQNTPSKEQNFTKDGFRRPDFGQPEERANISGLVKDIIGNEVTILKIERPNRNAEQNEIENGENTQGEQQKNNEQTNNQSRTNITRNFNGGTGMGPGMGMRGGTRPEITEENRAAMLERIKSMSSGEEKVLIPIGIRMLKMSNGEAVEATLEDVKQDSMLMLWTDQSITDRNIATFVMIN